MTPAQPVDEKPASQEVEQVAATAAGDSDSADENTRVQAKKRKRLKKKVRVQDSDDSDADDDAAAAAAAATAATGAATTAAAAPAAPAAADTAAATAATDAAPAPKKAKAEAPAPAAAAAKQPKAAVHSFFAPRKAAAAAPAPVPAPAPAKAAETKAAEPPAKVLEPKVEPKLEPGLAAAAAEDPAAAAAPAHPTASAPAASSSSSSASSSSSSTVPAADEGEDGDAAMSDAEQEEAAAAADVKLEQTVAVKAEAGGGGFSKKKKSSKPEPSKAKKKQTVAFAKAALAFDPVGAASWKAGEAVPYLALTDIFLAIDVITARLEIQTLLTQFFRSVIALTPGDLTACVFLATNKLAPAFDNIEIGIGDSLLMKAIVESTGRKLAQVKAEYQEVGDLGKVAMKSRSSQSMLGFGAKPKVLSVSAVLGALKTVAAVAGGNSQNIKVGHIKKMLVACRESEAMFAIRALQGKLRIGLAESTVLVSLAHAIALQPAAGSPQPQPPSRPTALEEYLEDAVEVVKQVYSECPTHNRMVPALLRLGIAGVHTECKLEPGIPVHPMLAKPTKGISEVLDRFSGIPFTCEYKYDGERAQIHLDRDGKIKIFSRSSEDTTERWPDVAVALPAALKGARNCVLDCEVVAWDREKEALLPFQVLSTRSRKAVEVKDVKCNVIIFAFDLLYLNDASLLKTPLKQRQAALRANFTEVAGQFQFAVAKEGTEIEELEQFLHEAVKDGTEGLMVKTLETNATYEPSKRSLNWLKLKKDYMDGMTDSLDLVPIGGYWGHGKRTGVFGAYLLACYDPDTEEFQTVCKAGTGFSEEDLVKHTAFYQDGNLLPKKPRNYAVDKVLECDAWFDAKQVWEMRCADLSISPVHLGGRGKVHASKGIGLRFPRFLRIRDDKPCEMATNAQQVADMYRNQDNVQLTAGGGGGDDDGADDMDDDEFL